MLDMVKPKIAGKIALSDLKKCRMTPIFFDTFFNLEKYLDHEQRDPFASQRDHDIDGQEVINFFKFIIIINFIISHLLSDVGLGQICGRGIRIISCGRRRKRSTRQPVNIFEFLIKIIQIICINLVEKVRF